VRCTRTADGSKMKPRLLFFICAALSASHAVAQEQAAVADEPLQAAESADAEPVEPQPEAPQPPKKEEPNNLPLALGGAAALAAVALLLGGGSKKKQPAALLLGPSNAGKTLLFHRLVNNELEETVASMKSCEGITDNKLLVDVPGHRRLRASVTAELKRATKIVFMVDAADATRQAKAAAELLYEIFCCESRPPLLILCNKRDKAGAKTPARVKLTLASEIETLHKTAKTMGSTGDDQQSVAPIDTGGKFFSFESHAPCACTFLAYSAKEDPLDAVREFLLK
jgi:signal recognition particle receptor subunit beta